MSPLAASPREVKLTLPPVPEAAARARRHLLRAGLHPDLEHTVSLLATELITNAVEHAGMDSDERLLLRARMTPDYARMELYDSGPGFDPGGPGAAEHGLGLRLVDRLASRWGVERRDAFCVWAEVDRRRRRFTTDGED